MKTLCNRKQFNVNCTSAQVVPSHPRYLYLVPLCLKAALGPGRHNTYRFSTALVVEPYVDRTCVLYPLSVTYAVVDWSHHARSDIYTLYVKFRLYCMSFELDDWKTYSDSGIYSHNYCVWFRYQL